MIITKTPLRVSLVGGGTDLPSFYRNHGGGAVVSFTIDKYVHIVANKPFENKVRVSYSKTENVKLAQDVQHELVRECLKKMCITHNIEIVSVSDIPGKGTGLGSSSAFVVGLLNALTQFGIKYRPANHACYEHLNVAEEACDVEIRMCGKNIGKQDQYASAYGGLNLIQFNQDDTVEIKRIPLVAERLELLNKRLMLFWTGATRKAHSILDVQNENIKNDDNAIYFLEKMRGYAHELYAELAHGNIAVVGQYLHKNWCLKKQLANGISSPQIDHWYNTARLNGAEGGKILGAGGAGFMLFYVPEHAQDAVRNCIGLREVPFSITDRGTELIYG